MKKVYSKPEVVFEDFSVTSTIATGCEEICNSAEYQCAYKFDDGFNIYKLFTVGVVSECRTGPEGIYDALCYHVPDGFNTFSS